MTNAQYITNALGGFSVSPATVDTIIAENGIVGTAAVDVTACQLAMYNSFYLVWPTATDISEGDLRIGYNPDAIRMFYRHLCQVLNKPDVLSTQPVVKGRGDLW